MAWGAFALGRRLIPYLWLLIAALPISLPAAEIEGVVFAEEVQVADTTLKLYGFGTVRYLALFKVYVGALYLPPEGLPLEGLPPEGLAGLPRRLELSYLYDFKAIDFRRAMRKRIIVGLNEEARARLAARIDAFGNFFRDVRAGERYAMTFVPGSGTTLFLNDKPLGTVPGADFAAALFDIWLGPDPLDEDFREAVLSGRKP